MKLTKAMFEAGKSDAGGYNLKQLKALGVPLPAKGWPASGWPERLIGSEVTDAQYAEFLALRKTTKAKENEAELFHKKTDPLASERAREFATKAIMCTHAGVMSLAIPLYSEIDRLKASLKVATDALIFVSQTLDCSQGTPASQVPIAVQVMDALDHLGFRQDFREGDHSPETYANNLFEESGRDLA